MIAIIMTAFNLLLLMVVWEFFAKKTILDYHRDKLFDLRREMRVAFLEKDALGSPVYKELRELINAQISLTENLSILQYILWDVNLKHKPELRALIEKENERRFSSDREDISKLVKEYRHKSAEICTSYMVFSSLLMTTFLIVFAFGALTYLSIKGIFSNCKQFFMDYKKVATLSIAIGMSRFKISQDTVEDASLVLVRAC